ncbi:hypothetical protein GCM10017597_29830 [Brachybacterium conglomeratum]|nr:hypothetical protein GCM10017597_29830 [Brachybacterium conglomeratum]
MDGSSRIFTMEVLLRRGGADAVRGAAGSAGTGHFTPRPHSARNSRVAMALGSGSDGSQG